MFQTVENILGVPQMQVQLTLADYRKFLGNDLSTTFMPYPGQMVRATDPVYGESWFMSGFGLASLAIGEAAVFGTGYAITRSAAASKGVVGISMAANTDSTALSWFCVQGQCPARLLAGTALPLYTSATAGSLTTTVVATQGVTGAFCLTALAATIISTSRVQTVNGSAQVLISDLAGLYVGAAFTGTTGITNGTTITAIGAGGVFGGAQGNPNYVLTLSANATATGTATATVIHGAAFATAMLQFPMIPGAV